MAEDFEHSGPGRQPRRRLSVLPLIAEPAGFLASLDVDHKVRTTFAYIDSGGPCSSQEAFLERQTLQTPALGIIPQVDSADSRFLTQQVSQQRLSAIHSIRQGLHDQHFIVPIDDQSR